MSEAENRFVGSGDDVKVEPPDAVAKTGALLELSEQLAAGSISQDEYEAAVKKLGGDGGKGEARTNGSARFSA